LKKYLFLLLALILLLGGVYSGYHFFKIELKARVAQILLQHAWNKSLIEGNSIKPWPSFDGTLIFKLEIPQHHISQIVLKGTSGMALAYGPSFHEESFLPSTNKITAISSHRDSHGNYIKNLQIGDILKLQDINGNLYIYKIEEFIIINIKEEIMINNNNRMLLITCYPFDTILSGTPFRYIVSAKNLEINNS